LDSGDLKEATLGLFDALCNRCWNFLRLAIADTDVSVTVTNDHESRETKATTALDDLGNSVDRNYALKQVRLLLAWAAIFAIPTLASATSAARRIRHCYLFPM
jgi:hypothetical protein